MEDCFRKYLPKKNPSELTILDPFAGVGTTLVEGLLHGFNIIGFEINPYAYLACKVKLSAARYETSMIEKATDNFLGYYQKREADKAYTPRTPAPKGFSTKKSTFYSPKVERKVQIFFDYLPSIKNLEIETCSSSLSVL